MNDPNHPAQSGQSEQPKKMSSRATNFLMMNTGAPKTGAEIAAEDNASPASANAVQASQTPQENYPEAAEAPESTQAPPPQKATGVVSYERMPAQRAGNATSPEQQQNAPRTQQLNAETGKTVKKTANLSPEEKQKIKEEKMDNLAERITDVLKRLNDFKTGLLDKEVRASQKIQLMAENSPGMSKLLGIMLHQLEPLLMLMQRINQKMVEKNLVQRPPKPVAESSEEPDENQPPPPPEKVSFVELAEKNIIFCDNRKRPLYTIEQMRDKYGRTASEEVLSPMIMENILKAFHEVAPKAKAIPTPSSGIYANIPMDQVMDGISEEDVMRFLNYVQRFPRGYVGKNFRITESFAGWVVSGTPDD